MAERKMTKRQKQKAIKGILTVICLIILAVLWFFIKPVFWDGDGEGTGQSTPNVNDNKVTYEVPEGTAEIHYIDVGQGDSTLIKVGDKNILIDTGEKEAKEQLISYLNDHDVEEIEYFVVTHYDSDHFANAVDILDTYDVKNLIVPNQIKTTNMYETFMAKVEEQVENGSIELLVANDMIEQKIDVNSLEITILAPLKEKYSSSNDYSIALMVRYGNIKALFTGDGEEEAEEEILNKYTSAVLDCDVFKLGHHGSSTSSCQELLNRATPTYVIVSCGLDNSYGHPHQEILERTEGMTMYRTDTQGSIVLSIANDELTFKTEK